MREFYPDSSFIRVIARPSGELTPSDLGSGFTFIHIDGGHSPEEVYHDLKLCYEVSAEGGLIALDDYFNPEHPGVCEGAVEFSLRHPGWLRPLVAGYNKVLFQKPRDHIDGFECCVSQGVSGSRIQDRSHVEVAGDSAGSAATGAYRPVRIHTGVLCSVWFRRMLEPGSSRPSRAFALVQGSTIDIEVKVENTSSEAFPAGEVIGSICETPGATEKPGSRHQSPHS